jgi:hypothetical protein
MGNKCCCGTRLCSPALGVALGIVSGLFMMVLAWVSWQWGYGSSIMTLYSGVFYGYEPTLVGGLFGALWGFMEGFIVGLIMGCIYNCVSRCCKCGKSCSCCGDKSSGACAK